MAMPALLPISPEDLSTAFFPREVMVQNKNSMVKALARADMKFTI